MQDYGDAPGDKTAVQDIRKFQEYNALTDNYIEHAERYYHAYKNKLLTKYGNIDNIPNDHVAKLSELCCQIAKARSLRTHW